MTKKSIYDTLHKKEVIMKTLVCKTCGSKTEHELMRKGGFLTKYRTILEYHWRCTTCGTTKKTSHTKWNKNVQLLD